VRNDGGIHRQAAATANQRHCLASNDQAATSRAGKSEGGKEVTEAQEFLALIDTLTETMREMFGVAAESTAKSMQEVTKAIEHDRAEHREYIGMIVQGFKNLKQRISALEEQASKPRRKRIIKDAAGDPVEIVDVIEEPEVSDADTAETA
jgi:hypothetical protein